MKQLTIEEIEALYYAFCEENGYTPCFPLQNTFCSAFMLGCKHIMVQQLETNATELERLKKENKDLTDT